MYNKVSKEQLKRFLKKKLSEDDRWALRALSVVYSNQTSDEAVSGDTHYYNDVGFTKFDCAFLTSLAEQYRENGKLSRKQLQYLKKVIPKYWNQVLNASEEQNKVDTLKEKATVEG